MEIEPAQVELNGRLITVKPAERREFDKAAGLFSQRDFRGCIQALNTFKKNWPKSAYTADADYWRASSYYALGDYKSVIQITNNISKTYPKSDKAPEALLMKSSSELSNGDLDAAKATLERLIKRYPKSEEAKTGKERLKEMNQIG